MDHMLRDSVDSQDKLTGQLFLIDHLISAWPNRVAAALASSHRWGRSRTPEGGGPISDFGSKPDKMGG